MDPWSRQTPANSTKLHEAQIPKKQQSLQHMESFIITAEDKQSLFLPPAEPEQPACTED